ncbi:MAG TPA: beta-ketoacyl-ACP synthase III [Acidimicrobiales bacterium]|nr:beta-ketoacyl-ACP synthase III [Acidimicrobiales bacterium]
MKSRIVGWGAALPDKVLTNADLEATLDTSDAWIVERTGIRERRVGGTTTGLALEAAEQALARADVAPGDLDLVLVATCTPDDALPAVATQVQRGLGAHCGALDVNAACSGFVYGLVAAEGFLRSGMRRVLVVGAETLSRIVDWDDRGTAILFGDGAGAVVLEAGEPDGPGGLLGWDLGSDGSLRHLLHADVGGTIVMDGPEVFRRAVRVMVDSAQRALEAAGLTADDLALVVPHQANQRIIASAAAKLGVPADRIAMVLETTGNTSAASIPLALADAADAGRLGPGDPVLLVGFGAGMTWASAVLEWSHTSERASEPASQASRSGTAAPRSSSRALPTSGLTR